MSASKTIEDVFISYANSRREETETLAAALQAAGFSTWWDTGLLPGDRFRAEIDEHLNGCRAAIIVWAPESIKSDWVLAEADHAWQLGKLVNVHVPGQKPRDIPKPFNQSHSVELANQSAIIEAVRKRIAAPAANEPTPEVSKVLADAAGPANTTHGMRRTIGWVVGVIATVVAIGTATVTLLPRLGSLASAPPQWTFKGDLFIGQPIPLAWSSNRTDADGRSAASVLFEIASSPDNLFRSGSRTETYADGDHKYIGHVNATRFWRLRTVDSQTKAAISEWSNILGITQYDSAYDRIKNTGKVLVSLSNAENQGAFKWVSNKGFQGFDIELVKLIDNELAARLGRSLEFVPIPVPWAQLLDTPAQGRADFIISSITKLEDRRRDFRVEFSDGYYCTTHALIYRVGKPDRPIREMITGKVVGVQDKTTNARLAEAMAKEGSLQIKAFDTTETLIDELLRSEIDYGIVDTPFAITAQLQNRSNGRDRLSFKEFKQVDFPPMIPDELQREEYALAVHAGEDELLGAINDVIAKAKRDGSLTRLFRQAATEFEDAFGLPSGSRGDKATTERPWECAS